MSATCGSVSQSRTCNDGTLSGTYTQPTCRDYYDCTGPDGATILHGNSKVYYTARYVASTSACTAVDQTRTCTDGTLSGSATYASCTVCGACETATATACVDTCATAYPACTDVRCFSGTCAWRDHLQTAATISCNSICTIDSLTDVCVAATLLDGTASTCASTTGTRWCFCAGAPRDNTVCQP